MAISVFVGNKKVVTADLDKTHDVFTQHISLSTHFRHPFDSSDPEQNPAGLTPLVATLQENFRALSLANDSNPFLLKLIQYGRDRLPAALNELSTAPVIPHADVNALLEKVSADRGGLSRLLGEMISRIDRDIPSFFELEKLLGTYEPLKTGLKKNAGVSLATDLPAHELFVALDPKDAQPIYGVGTNTAVIPDDIDLSAAAVIKSLCLGGGCGEALRIMNRAAAMRAILEPKREAIRRTHLVAYHPSVITGLTIVSCYTLYQFAAQSFATVTSGSLFGLLAVTAKYAAALTGLGFIKKVADIGLLGEGDCAHQYTRQKRSPLLMTGRESLSVMGVTLLNFIDDHGASRTATAVAPHTQSFWQEQFASKTKMDPCMPHRFSEIGLIRDDDTYLTQREYDDLRERLQQLGLESAIASAEHAQTADINMNLLKAIVAVSSFASRVKLPIEEERRPDLHSLLYSASYQELDRQGQHPQIAKSFDALRNQFGLTKEDWSFAARPLLMAYTFERIVSQNRAQQIAIDTLKDFSSQS